MTLTANLFASQKQRSRLLGNDLQTALRQIQNQVNQRAPYCLVAQYGAWSTSSSLADLGFNTVVDDSFGCFSGGSFTVPVPGTYQFTAYAAATATGAGQWIQIALQQSRLGTFYGTTGSASIGALMSCSICATFHNCQIGPQADNVIVQTLSSTSGLAGGQSSLGNYVTYAILNWLGPND